MTTIYDTKSIVYGLSNGISSAVAYAVETMALLLQELVNTSLGGRPIVNISAIKNLLQGTAWPITKQNSLVPVSAVYQGARMLNIAKASNNGATIFPASINLNLLPSQSVVRSVYVSDHRMCINTASFIFQ
jgi:hypothetical protein